VIALLFTYGFNATVPYFLLSLAIRNGLGEGKPIGRQKPVESIAGFDLGSVQGETASNGLGILPDMVGCLISCQKNRRVAN